MKKYWTIFRVELENTIAFRGPAFIWMLFDLLWIVVYPFIWVFVIRAQGGEIQGWNVTAIIFYFVFMAAMNNFILMHPEVHVGDEIYTGRFSNYIVKPLSYLANAFIHETAWKVVRTILFVPILFLLIFIILRLGGFTIHANQVPFAILVALLAVPIYFLSAFIIGLTSFWLEDSSIARTIFWTTSGLFGGQYAPFELMPRFLDRIASALPFKYAIYFPLRVASQTMSSAEILRGVLMQVIWMIALFILAKLVWKKGLTRYSAVGR